MPAMVLFRAHILPRIDMILFTSSQPPCPTCVKIALQDHRRRYGVDVTLLPPSPPSTLVKHPFRHGGRQALIPENDRDLRSDRGRQGIRELAHDCRLWAFSARKSGRKPDDEAVDSLRHSQIPQLGPVAISSLHDRQRRRDHAELVANSHTDAALADIETHRPPGTSTLNHLAISNWIRPALFGICSGNQAGW
jgi:hypothetical protein